MSANLPQLQMRLKDLSHLPPLELPPTLTVHTQQEDSAAAWERIITDSFKSPFSYKMMVEDPSYAPDRIFFVREHLQDVATAAAYLRPQYPGEGYIHMVGAHSWAAGNHAGYYAVLAALHRLRADGLPSAVLTTDDFRLPAISIYLRLGFQPVMNHESHPARWQAVMENLARYQKPSVSPIPLWPQGDAPFQAQAPDQAQPSLMPFPVPGSRGAVIVCPGGAYRFKSWFEGDPICRMIRACGVSAYTLDYRVMPASLEAPIADAQRAIRLLRSMGYEKVAILGFSAGGHLSCMAAVHWDEGSPDSPDPVERHSSRPDAFCPCYAATRAPGWLGIDAERYDSILHINAQTPTAFIWHSCNDQTVPVSSSLDLMSALNAAGVPYESHLFPDAPHGMGLAFGTSAEEWGSLLQKWLLRQGFGRNK